ncbi:MAG: 3-oxoacid CoA-transferase [Thermodesulfobacteriota bacterium]|jgi:3-oxoacid CoA-transferase
MRKPLLPATAAVADIPDGASLLVGGFGVLQGWPHELLFALRDRGVKDLTLICNSPGFGPLSPQILAENRQIKKLIASFGGYAYRVTPLSDQIARGEVEFEMVPQGTLVERVRAAGAGIPAFFTPTGVGTVVETGKEKRVFNGRAYLLETALHADFALIRAYQADAYGNLVYRRTARNFNPPFATAARVTIAEVDEVVEPGVLDPEAVVTPGIFVHRLVRRETPLRRETVLELMRRLGRNVKIAEQASPDGRGLSPELMALRAARLLSAGQYVNLGIGLPTLVSEFLSDQVMLHAENGVLGYGPLAPAGEEDTDLYNASSQLVTLLPGASFFHSADAFTMARGGHLDTVVLGGFQVAENGDLANWKTPTMGAGAVGGAMDLAVGARTVIVVMFHTTKAGEPKLLRTCTYPLTARGCVSWVVTNLALIAIDRDGFLLHELAPGVTVEEVRAATAAPLRVAADLHEMAFSPGEEGL